MYEMDYRYCVAVLNVRHNLKDMGHGEIFLEKSWHSVHHMMYTIYYEVKIKLSANVKTSHV